MTKGLICCICGKRITDEGNDPWGAKWYDNGKVIAPTFSEDDRCCKDCNVRYVIPGRMHYINVKVQKEEK